jgi:hypothetical protein
VGCRPEARRHGCEPLISCPPELVHGVDLAIHKTLARLFECAPARDFTHVHAPATLLRSNAILDRPARPSHAGVLHLLAHATTGLTTGISQPHPGRARRAGHPSCASVRPPADRNQRQRREQILPPAPRPPSTLGARRPDPARHRNWATNWATPGISRSRSPTGWAFPPPPGWWTPYRAECFLWARPASCAVAPDGPDLFVEHGSAAEAVSWGAGRQQRRCHP